MIYDKKILSIGILVGLTFSSSICLAQPDTQSTNVISVKKIEKNPDALNFGAYGVPVSPILAITGLSANELTKVDEIQNYSLTLPNLVDGEKAIALDLNPASLLFPLKNYQDTKDRYRNSSMPYRIIRRTNISTLARNGKKNIEDPTKSQKSLLAFGLSTSLFDSSDPYYQVSRDESECQNFFAQAKTEPIQFGITENARPLQARLEDILEHIEDIPTRPNLSEKPAYLSSLKTNIELLNNVGSNPILSGYGYTPFTFDTRNTFESNLISVETLTHSLLGYIAIEYKRQEEPGQALKDSYTVCADAFKESLLYSPSLDFGAAAIWRGVEDGFGDFESGGQALWLSYRHPVILNKATNTTNSKSFFVVGLNGRAGFAEQATTGDMTTPEAKANTLQGWLGSEFFTDKWRVAGQVGYVDVKFKDPLMQGFSRNGERWQITADYQVRENTWIGLSYGEAQGTIDALQGERLTVDLRFSQPQILDLFNLQD